MVNINCNDCNGDCCRNKQMLVPLDLFSLARLLYHLNEYHFFETNTKGFGSVLKNNQPIINVTLIKDQKTLEENPIAYIESPCKLLNEYGMCGIHDLTVDKDSILGENLTTLDASLRIEPRACREYPANIDFGQENKNVYCINNKKATINKEETLEIAKEILTAVYINARLTQHWTITKNYPIIKIAKDMITKPDFYTEWESKLELDNKLIIYNKWLDNQEK